jgi:hypothetical protein
MATYAELLSASEDPGLKNKVRVALTIAAEAIRTEGAVANHAARLALAKAISLAPAAAATLATILAASDATVQTAVNAAIDVFV